MKKLLKNILKQNIWIYKIYHISVSTLLRILSVFIKVDENVILINSFGGIKFDDSPRVIFEYIKSQEKYNGYEIYWAFHEPEKHEVEGAYKIKTDTLKYFYIALKAKYWITNSAIERGLRFKNKKTIYINTWHGTPLKKMGSDIGTKKAYKFKTSQCDVMYAQSKYDIEVFSRAFDIPKEKFALVGLPRNDELVNVNEKEINDIKINLNIPLDKKIILYAPTFREYSRDINGCVIAPPVNIEKWKEKLKDKYIVLFRAHYEVNQVLNIKLDEFLYDMSSYKNLNELMKISDILITDYSSIMFDFSILERPIFFYTYDYQEYKNKRGMYFELKDEILGNCTENEDELIDKILKINYEKQLDKIRKFKNKYVQACGEARKYIEKIIKEK